MDVSPGGMTAQRRPKQFTKARSPTSASPRGMLMDWRKLHPAKALFPIFMPAPIFTR